MLLGVPYREQRIRCRLHVPVHQLQPDDLVGDGVPELHDAVNQAPMHLGNDLSCDRLIVDDVAATPEPRRSGDRVYISPPSRRNYASVSQRSGQGIPPFRRVSTSIVVFPREGLSLRRVKPRGWGSLAYCGSDSFFCCRTALLGSTVSYFIGGPSFPSLLSVSHTPPCPSMPYSTDDYGRQVFEAC